LTYPKHYVPTLNFSDIVGPDAVNKHYQLLIAVMRVICAAVLSRGSQNQQTLEQGRRFLSENRLSVLAVLKKSARLGNASGTSQQSIDDLSSSFMLLMTMTGFLDVSGPLH
jgi:nuclear pore complex protein Nup205